MRKRILALLVLTMSVLALVDVAGAEHHEGLGAILAAQAADVQARYKYQRWRSSVLNRA